MEQRSLLKRTASLLELERRKMNQRIVYKWLLRNLTGRYRDFSPPTSITSSLGISTTSIGKDITAPHDKRQRRVIDIVCERNWITCKTNKAAFLVSCSVTTPEENFNRRLGTILRFVYTEMHMESFIFPFAITKKLGNRGTLITPLTGRIDGCTYLFDKQTAGVA